MSIHYDAAVSYLRVETDKHASLFKGGTVRLSAHWQAQCLQIFALETSVTRP